jgi:hypothetical protein
MLIFSGYLIWQLVIVPHDGTLVILDLYKTDLSISFLLPCYRCSRQEQLPGGDDEDGREVQEEDVGVSI